MLKFNSTVFVNDWNDKFELYAYKNTSQNSKNNNF